MTTYTAYSIDLRLRVLRDADAGLPSDELAEKYSVSRAWVDRLKQRRREGFVNLPDAGRVAGQDPNLGGCSRSTRHHVPFGERSGAERAVMSGS